MNEFLYRYNSNIYRIEEVFDIRLDRIISESLDDFVDLLSKDDIYEEKPIQKPLISRIKIFFANLISEVRRFFKELQVKFQETFRGVYYGRMIHKMADDIDKAKAQGKTKVEMKDFETLAKEYKSMHSELSKYTKKFVKMKYKYTTNISEDLYKFEKLCDEYEEKLDKIQDKTIVVPIDKAKEFVDKEISGRTEILLTMNQLISDLDMMSFVAQETANRREFLGSDILKEHVGAIRSMSTKFVKFTKKFTVKCIVWNVLRFAD